MGQAGHERDQHGAGEALGQIVGGDGGKERPDFRRMLRHQQKSEVRQRDADRGHRQQLTDIERGNAHAAEEGAADTEPDAVEFRHRGDIGFGIARIQIERTGQYADHLIRKFVQPNEHEKRQCQQHAVARKKLTEGFDEGFGQTGLADGDTGGGLARQQRGRERQQHQQRHQGVCGFPAEQFCEIQRHGTAENQADAVTEGVSGRQRALRVNLDNLDPVCVHQDVLGGAGKRGQRDECNQRAEMHRRIGVRHGQQRHHQQQLRNEQPTPAPAEQRQGIAVQQRCPEEFQDIEETGETEQADQAERQSDIAQPGRQRAADDQQERQAAA